jgi:seryl-tRNA synthetase
MDGVSPSARIHWDLIAEAMEFYTGEGFTPVETPWIASAKAVAITCPRGLVPMMVPGLGALVGSAEQGFLDMELKGALPKGRFISCGPCFRDEAVDALHQKTFFKVELYQNAKVTDISLEQMINQAKGFFESHLNAGPVVRETTEFGYDLTLNGVEIGSYGIRHTRDVSWIYGTGLALPRFTQALAAR